MTRVKPVELATRSFDNQSVATNYFKDMLACYAPGDRVNEDDGLDLSALLERHDEYRIKIGSGVSHFEVMKTDYGTNCFRIIRTDESGTDFSYRDCITKKPPTRKQEVSQAFRQVVRFDLYKARDKFFAEHADKEGLFTCAVTNERISRDEAHMDHRPPMTFEVIVTTFLESRGLSLDQVGITTGGDEQVSPEIIDKNLGEEFRTYHARVARLDFVKSTVNLAQASRLRIRKSRITIDKS